MRKNQEEIINHLKGQGFVYQGSEIYGGLANSWDFGPLGSLMKMNLKNLWWKYFVIKDPNAVGLDSGIILNPSVWEASGHLTNFCDPLLDCKECKNRFRADKLIEEFDESIQVNEQMQTSELEDIINKNQIKCPNCGKFNWTPIRKFNLLFETSIGKVEDKKNIVYLRPETAQGIFINFKNIQRTSRIKLPFGVGQIGKAFRNEITPSNFIFRTKEFEQMELEYFVEEKDEDKIFNYLLNKIENFLINILGINKENLKQLDYPKDELAHYAKRTIDFLYNFPHGWSELWGIANRGTFDLTNHQELSKKSLEYIDLEENKKVLPTIIEPSVGVERLLYAILIDAYNVEKVNDEDRIVLKLAYDIAPYKCCVLPLSNKLKEQAFKIYEDIIDADISTTFDASGSIGKRYRRQDSIGTFYCITYDFDSETDQCVTIRNRDTMEQKRVKISDLTKILRRDIKWEEMN